MWALAVMHFAHLGPACLHVVSLPACMQELYVKLQSTTAGVAHSMPVHSATLTAFSHCQVAGSESLVAGSESLVADSESLVADCDHIIQVLIVSTLLDC